MENFCAEKKKKTTKNSKMSEEEKFFLCIFDRETRYTRRSRDRFWHQNVIQNDYVLTTEFSMKY